VSEDGGFFYDYASYEEGSSQIGQAGDDLAAAGDDYAAVQGRASAQLRQWPPTVPVADTLDQVEAKLSEATQLGADDLGWTSGQLTAARDTMLETEGNNTALAQRAAQDLRDSDPSPLGGDSGTAADQSGFPAVSSMSRVTCPRRWGRIRRSTRQAPSRCFIWRRRPELRRCTWTASRSSPASVSCSLAADCPARWTGWRM
jgi:hypothetical protein